MEDNKNIIEQLQEKIEKLESEMDNIKSVLEIQDEDEFDYDSDSDEDDLEDLEDGDDGLRQTPPQYQTHHVKVHRHPLVPA